MVHRSLPVAVCLLFALDCTLAFSDPRASQQTGDVDYQAIYRNSLPEIEMTTRGGDPVYRIVGGKPARPGAWPSMVALRFRSRPICGGSVIDRFWILTAAHCVANRDIAE